MTPDFGKPVPPDIEVYRGSKLLRLLWNLSVTIIWVVFLTGLLTVGSVYRLQPQIKDFPIIVLAMLWLLALLLCACLIALHVLRVGQEEVRHMLTQLLREKRRRSSYESIIGHGVDFEDPRGGLYGDDSF